MQVWAKGSRNSLNLGLGWQHADLFGPVYGVEDAENAIKYGLDGIIISNHGGRQLDSVPASLDVLREVSSVVKGRIPIGVDGGIRRGTDIFKALALGADFCFAGRPAIRGLAVSHRGLELSS